jgi:hypothetical protein
MQIVRLLGGLGNQLFQYAAGLSAATRKGTQLKLDITGYSADSGRSPDILDFNISAGIATLPEVEAARHVPFGLLGRKFRQFKYKYLVNYYVGHITGLLAADRGRYMDGYFQSERCFADVTSRVRREFTLKQEFAEPLRPVIARLHSLGTTVSVHVRRGDFVGSERNQQILSVCGPDYYRNAFAEMRSWLGSFTPVVFSDDIEWVRSNMDLGEGVRFAPDLGEGLSAAQEMVLMSHCSHQIIANSTFSWWAAYLNPASHQIVVAPSIWARGLPGYDHIIPPTWRIVDVAAPVPFRHA